MEQFHKSVDRSEEFSAKYDEMEMKFGRSDVYSMWVADMDFEVAPPIYKAIEKRASQPIYGYTTRPDSYLNAMTSWYTRRYGFDIKQEWLIHSPGVVTSLNVAVRELTEKGDKIIIQSPVYYPFFDSVLLNGRELLDNPLCIVDGKYEMDYTGLEELAKEASFIILCNPHNPVGRVWTKVELEKLADICLRNDVRIISDEIHGDIVFGEARYTPMASLSEAINNITITCLSATKSFNIAGLQASFMLVPRADEFEKIQRFFAMMDMKRNNCFSLVAVEAASSDGEPWLESMIDYVKENMNYVHSFCKERIPEIKPNKPEGTYLLWLDCKSLGFEDEELFDFMTNKAKIALNTGVSFGLQGSGYVRLNLACPRKTVEDSMLSLEKATKELMS